MFSILSFLLHYSGFITVNENQDTVRKTDKLIPDIHKSETLLNLSLINLYPAEFLNGLVLLPFLELPIINFRDISIRMQQVWNLLRLDGHTGWNGSILMTKANISFSFSL